MSVSVSSFISVSARLRFYSLTNFHSPDCAEDLAARAALVGHHPAALTDTRSRDSDRRRVRRNLLNDAPRALHGVPREQLGTLHNIGHGASSLSIASQTRSHVILTSYPVDGPAYRELPTPSAFDHGPGI